jgi:hypothetical protein
LPYSFLVGVTTSRREERAMFEDDELGSEGECLFSLFEYQLIAIALNLWREASERFGEPSMVEETIALHDRVSAMILALTG